MAQTLDAVTEEVKALEKRLNEPRKRRNELKIQLQNERCQVVGAAVLAELDKEDGVVDEAFLMPLL